jgi:hypothetical protein
MLILLLICNSIYFYQILRVTVLTVSLFLLMVFLFFISVFYSLPFIVDPFHNSAIVSFIVGSTISFLLLLQPIKLYKTLATLSEQHLDKLCIVLVLLCLNDFTTIMIAVTTKSRMLYDSSPISIAIIACVGVISFIFNNSRGRLSFIIVIFNLLVITLMMSRGPLLALCVVSALYLLSERKYFILMMFSFLASSLFMIFILLRKGNAEHSVSVRGNLLRHALEAIGDNPLLGFLGQFQKVGGFGYPHNSYIEAWTELNVFISAMYCLIFIYLLFSLSKKNNQYHIFTSVFVFLSICMLFSLPFLEMQKIYLPLMFLSLYVCSSRNQIYASNSFGSVALCVKK